MTQTRINNIDKKLSRKLKGLAKLSNYEPNES